MLSPSPTYISDVAGFYQIKTEVDGRQCRGEWCIRQGSRLCVRSAWGSLTVPLCGRRRRPEAWAAIVLKILVRDYYRRQAAEWARQEREAIRLGGKRRTRPRDAAPPETVGGTRHERR